MEKTKFEVKPVGNHFRVFDTTDGKAITKDCPEDIAKEICEDFNAMENKDFRAIGGPDDSADKPN